MRADAMAATCLASASDAARTAAAADVAAPGDAI